MVKKKSLKNKLIRHSVALCGCCAILFTLQCGTIINGRAHDYEFDSSPAGATVTLYIVQSGITGARSYGQFRPIATKFVAPGSAEIQMDTHYIVEFKLEGYKDLSMAVGREFSYVALLNLGIGPFWLVDILTGGLYVPANEGRISARLETDEDSVAVLLTVQVGSGARRVARVPLKPGRGKVEVSLTDSSFQAQ